MTSSHETGRVCEDGNMGRGTYMEGGCGGRVEEGGHMRCTYKDCVGGGWIQNSEAVHGSPQASSS